VPLRQIFKSQHIAAASDMPLTLDGVDDVGTDSQKCCLSRLLHSKCTRALTFENACSALPTRRRFSKVLCIVPLYSKYTRALTIENLCMAMI